MKNAARRIAGILTCVAVLGAALAFAQDWPQWRGTNRDGKASGFTAPKEWPKELKQVWKVKVGQDDSTPALVGEKLYVFARQGGDEVTLCLSAKDGNVIWQDKFAAAAVTGAAKSHPGPRSSPAVADGKVITMGVTGVLSCLDAAKGTLLWRKDDIKGQPKFFTSSSPIVVDGLCIAQLGGADNGEIVAYTLDKGEKKWSVPGGAAYASPVVATIDGVKQIITLTDKAVVGISIEGKPLWDVPFLRDYNAATPIVDGSTVYYSGNGRGTHALKIEKKGDSFAATELWSNKEVAVQYNSPVLKDGFLYGLTDKGRLFCLDAKDGKTAWTDTADHKNFGAIVDCGSVLMCLPMNGELLVYKPSGKGYEEVAKYKVGMGTYASPVVVGQRIFTKDAENLTLWTLE